MAKIGGMEILVVLIVALFVIGPERMPKVARKVGRMFGSFKRQMNDAMKDLKDATDEFDVVEDTIRDVRKEMKSVMDDTSKEMKSVMDDTDKEIKKTSREVDELMSDKPKKEEAAEGEEKA